MKAGGRIRRLRAEISDIIESMLKEETDPSVDWNPRTDLVEFDDHFEVCLEVPGMLAADVTIEIRDRTLRIHGEKRRSNNEPTALRYHMMERFVGPFEASIDVPRSILPHASTARLANGVLIIKLTKVADQRHRSYTVVVEEEPENQ